MITGADQANAMCAAGLYDVLMPDVKYAGGYRGMLAIARLCASHNVLFAPHNPTGPIAHLASIQACAAAPEVLWLEHQWAESPLFDQLSVAMWHRSSTAPSSFRVRRGLAPGSNVTWRWARPYVPIPRSANLDERLG